MRQAAIRIETNLKQILELKSKDHGLKFSEFLRRVINTGIQYKKNGGEKLGGPQGLEIPLEEIDFGGPQIRLNFYLDDDYIDEAMAVFNESDQSVLRKALRIGLWKIHFIESFVITDSIQRILINEVTPFLNPDNQNIDTVIVCGPYGSGKSHLTGYVSSIAENEGLLDFTDQKVRESLSQFAGKYGVVRIPLEEIAYASRGNQVPLIPTAENSEDLTLVTIELETEEDLELYLKVRMSSSNCKFMVESNKPTIIEELLRNNRNAAKIELSNAYVQEIVDLVKGRMKTRITPSLHAAYL